MATGAEQFGPIYEDRALTVPKDKLPSNPSVRDGGGRQQTRARIKEALAVDSGAPC
jgi:hypothetical protein